MKLYVWDNFIQIWTPGLAIAIATSQDAAKNAVEKETGGVYRPVGDAAVYDLSKPVVYYRTGCE